MTTQSENFTKEFEAYIISIGKYVPLIDIKIIWNQIINIANNYDIDFDVLKEVVTFKSSFIGFLLSLICLDRFYRTKYVSAVFKILTLGGLYIWWGIDILLILNGQIKKDNSNKLLAFLDELEKEYKIKSRDLIIPHQVRIDENNIYEADEDIFEDGTQFEKKVYDLNDFWGRELCCYLPKKIRCWCCCYEF